VEQHFLNKYPQERTKSIPQNCFYFLLPLKG
jgi:hypothetical protein